MEDPTKILEAMVAVWAESQGLCYQVEAREAGKLTIVTEYGPPGLEDRVFRFTVEEE